MIDSFLGMLCIRWEGGLKRGFGREAGCECMEGGLRGS